MKRDIVWTKQFKKDHKLAIRCCMNIDLLDDVIRALLRGEKLPEKNKDHELSVRKELLGHILLLSLSDVN